MKWDDKQFPIRFMPEGIQSRPATPDDQPYLDWLSRVVGDAALDDPGEQAEVEGRALTDAEILRRQGP